MKTLILALGLLLGWTFAVTRAAADEGEGDMLALLSYKPIYFLMGNPYTKIELSFKTQIVRALPVYFGYTQLMMWDLFIHSPFFYDLNYNPLAWYRINFDVSSEQWLDLIPWEHESNGKGGLLERAWDRTGVAYHQRLALGEETKLYASVKAWVPFHYNPNNEDLAQYRGVWQLDLTLSDFMGSMFEFSDLIFTLYPGGDYYTNPIRGGQELTLRLKSVYREFMPLFVAQIFHGYGEYLQDYQDEHWGFRIGVGF
jgi:outer membrane phospholipase A